MSQLTDQIRARQREAPPHLCGLPHNATDSFTRHVTNWVAKVTGIELVPGDIWVHQASGGFHMGQVTRAGEQAMHVVSGRFEGESGTLEPALPPYQTPAECTCDCHSDDHVMHFEACCDGACPHCNRHFHGLQNHIEDEHGVA